MARSKQEEIQRPDYDLANGDTNGGPTPNKQKKVPLKGPLNVKVPRIAKRNLRDHGCLSDETNSDKASMVSDVSDEFVPGIQDVETQNRLTITLN